jgi:hypothetical protein
MAYTPEQIAQTQALLAKGDALGQAASQQTGVAYAPQYTSAPYTSSTGQATYNNPAAPVTYTPSAGTTTSIPGAFNPSTFKPGDTNFYDYTLAGYAGSAPVYSKNGTYTTIKPSGTGVGYSTDRDLGTDPGAYEWLLGKWSPAQQQAQASTGTTGESPVSQGDGQKPTTSAQAATAAGQQYSPAQALTMPASGSVVDLLNMAGQDSSFAARQQLAKQYGIQGYSGTASQNQQLAQKYLDAYNKNKNSAAPATPADARASLQSYFDEEKSMTDPQQAFIDSFAGMNPIVATLYSSINNILSSANTKSTLVEEYNNLMQSTGIQGIQADLMNMNRIIDGTEDDIRAEVTAAGGFATESQVQALTAARNKTLIKRANELSDQLALKQDYVNQIVNLTGQDRAAAERSVDRALGLTNTLANFQLQLDNAARQNYNTLISQVGYGGLAAALQQNPAAMRNAEQMLGLGKGALSDPAFLALTEQQQEWGEPFVLGGSYVQMNQKTGEIRTAASLKSEGGGGLTPYQMANFAAGLRDDVRTDPDVKDFIGIRDGYERIKAGSELGTGQGDLAIIFGYGKMLDPESVVRETEFANAEAAMGYMQKAINIPDKFIKGDRLTAEGRQFFVTAAEKLYQTKKVNYDNAVSFYGETSMAYGIPPELIMRDFASQSQTIPPGGILINRNGQQGYITSMLEFNPKTDKLI